MRHRLSPALLAIASALAADAALAADPAPVFRPLAQFDAANNGYVHGKLAIGPDGRLYGAERTSTGERIFRVEADGVLTTIHVLDTATEGALPEGGLLAAADGWLYGTSEAAGGGGAGTIWRVAPDGRFELLHTFTAADGTSGPNSTLALGPDGAFYGTAYGDNGALPGAVFRLAADGGLSLVHAFSDPTQGQQPHGVAFGTDGLMYGTAYLGGYQHLGVLYSLALDGTYTVRHSFHCAVDGCRPQGGLLLGNAGRLLGVTTYGGAGGGGTVFAYTPPHGFHVLHSFIADGSPWWPIGELSQDPYGRLYGVTGEGGAVPAWGTVYRMDSDGGDFSVLHAFRDGRDGGVPQTGPTLAPDGSVVGMSTFGGTNDGGTLYRITAAR